MRDGKDQGLLPETRPQGAIIAYNDRRSTLPCTVRDLSETGARLRVDSAPDAFTLIIELDGAEDDCKVIWRKPPQLAVTFVGPLRKVTPTRAQVVTAVIPENKPGVQFI